MILADDNFASITAAVKEGRTVYNNIEKAILFMLPTNVAQALVIAVAIFFGFTMPITAPQVLWVNMITSVALGLVISFEPHELDVMQRQPRAVDRPIVDGFGIWRVIFGGCGICMGNASQHLWKGPSNIWVDCLRSLTSEQGSTRSGTSRMKCPRGRRKSWRRLRVLRFSPSIDAP